MTLPFHHINNNNNDKVSQNKFVKKFKQNKEQDGQWNSVLRANFIRSVKQTNLKNVE